MELEVYHYWIIVGLILAAAEMVVPGFVIIWFGIGAFAAALAAFLNAGTNVQIFLFALVSIVLASASQLIFKKILFPKHEEGLKTNTDALVGAKAVVEEEIKNTLQPGAVKIQGSVWSAFLAKENMPPQKKGAIVVVERVDGVKLIVKPLEKSEAQPVTNSNN